MVATNRRSAMTLYSGSSDIESHRVRIVLAEKGVQADIIEVGRFDDGEEDLRELNPYNSVPTLVDRDLVLYDSRIIMEYLEERFPHPPLLSVYPIARAKSRLMMYRFDKDWLELIELIQKGGAQAKVTKAQKTLQEQLIALIPVFQEHPYFLSEEFSLVDCYIAPILWRLPLFDVDLPDQAKPIMEYMNRIFNRESFKQSLTDEEHEIRL